MDLIQIIILAVIQGFAELLPVSSSAHVIIAQHLMNLDPGAPEMTFLIVMLHTGTMFAVLIYFWSRWKKLLNGQAESRKFLKAVIIATGVTGVLGLSLKFLIEKVIMEHFLGFAKGEVEHLFRVLPLISLALFSVGLLIIYAGFKSKKNAHAELNDKVALRIGLVQGLCLPFRGFSRSGATISTGLLMGISRDLAEEFSFALAVVVTPPVILLQLKRLLTAYQGTEVHIAQLLMPGLTGMVFSFLAGLVALRWLSSWLEKGRWQYFGYYCLALSCVVLALSTQNW